MRRTLFPLVAYLSLSFTSLSSAQYWFDDLDLTEPHWQEGITDNWLLEKYSTDTIFYSQQPTTTCPTINEELYRSRGLDPAWGPVPEIWACTGGPLPIPDGNWKSLNKRIRFPPGHFPGVAKVQCFPNVERGRPGPVIYTLCAGKPEMEFLGLLAELETKKDTFRSMRDRDEEDRLCERMRLLGAQEFEGYFYMAPYGAMMVGSRVESENWCSENDFNYRYGVTLFGWPKTGGGVWVLKLDPEGLQAVGGIKRLRNEKNVDMETQSRLIEDLGGRFYADPVECPELEFLRGPRFALAVVDE